MKKLYAPAIACIAVACIAIAGARDARAQEQQSFRTIMGKGYEIKSVTFARGEATDNRERAAGSLSLPKIERKRKPRLSIVKSELRRHHADDRERLVVE